MRRLASIADCRSSYSAPALLAQSGTVTHPGTSASGEWTHYGGNAASQKYSPLDQINKDTIGKLAIAWRWASPDNAVVEANPTARPGGYADTPLMVKGVLYTVTSLGQIAAINPATGADDLGRRSRQLEDGPARQSRLRAPRPGVLDRWARSSACCSARTTPI